MHIKQKKMKSLLQIRTLGLAFLLITIITFSACKKDEPAQPGEIELAKKFVFDYTRSFYLWEEHIPDGIDYNAYSDPFELLDAMYYDILDLWSFVTDDYYGIQNSLDGIRKAAGYKYRQIPTGGTNFYALVEYVHTDGEAFKAGLERGNVIMKVNDQTLTIDNYQTLLYQDVMVFDIGELVGENVVDLNKTVTVSPKEQAFNPILLSKVIDTGSKKVGYFLYDQFIEDYENELIAVLSDFSTQGIDDMVLDLRYNPGGYVSTCGKFASMILSASNTGDVFLTQQWNDYLTTEFNKETDADSYFNLYFPSVPVNLGLSRLYVLTSNRSASASEAIINALESYIPVTIIGGQTSGKYTAAALFHDDKTALIDNWGLYLVINKIANADGVTDYVNGLTPDHLVYDDYTTPLGDETEPLLAKALELIDGVPVKTSKVLPEIYKNTKPGFENWMDKEGAMIQKELPSLIKK